MAAKKKQDGAARGAALIKKAIAAGKEQGQFSDPQPVPAGILKKLRLPNDEKISPAMKELLSFDGSFLGFDFDDEEPEFDTVALEDVVESEFGEENVSSFGEAYDLLGEDCILLGGEGDERSVLYVGSPDAAGEYAVITLRTGETNRVEGFVPFDVWVAQQLGALPKDKVPEEYAAFVKELADANGDGRTSFEPKEGEAREKGGDDDEDEDEEDEDEDEEEEEAR
jgi:hypothetical protein